MSRRVAINLAAFTAVFVVMLWWAVNNIITFDFIERPYQISAEFAATAGVSENSEVAYLGVNHGSVRSVESAEGRVVITMDIDRGKQIPAGSVARIFRKSAIGEPYIDFEPPDGYTDGGPWIEAGTTIPMVEEDGTVRTTVPLEFSDMLRSASRVLSAVDADQTGTLVHELAAALNGRGEALRGLVVDSDALLQTFADRAELLDRLSANSTRLTRTVTEHRRSLSSAVRDLAALGESLRRVDPDTRVLLERGTELLGRTADLVADVKTDVDCVLSDLEGVIGATSTDEQLGFLANTLRTGPTAMHYVFSTRDDEPGGLWLRVNVIVNQENPAESYVPPHELPPVPEVPPCTSTLESRGVRFLADGRGTTPFAAAGATRPTGGARPGQAGVFLLASAAVLALAARRGRTT